MTVLPKRELGQHFLVDENILAVIARLAELDSEDVVLEIGPGLGILTRYLAERVARVHAVELDRRLAPQLATLPANVEVEFADALRTDLGRLEPTKLVANLPYNIATPVIVESLDGLPTVLLWCVMVQREAAERFFARPSTQPYGAVSVLVQLVTERTGIHPVSPNVFRPRPSVDSALLAFRRRTDATSSLLRGGRWGRVKRVVEGAFAHRRKTLPNSLALAGVAERDRVAAGLAAIGRSPGARAQELAPAEFVALAEALA